MFAVIHIRISIALLRGGVIAASRSLLAAIFLIVIFIAGRTPYPRVGGRIISLLVLRI